jgi:hypothetical protein
MDEIQLAFRLRESRRRLDFVGAVRNSRAAEAVKPRAAWEAAAGRRGYNSRRKCGGKP